MSKSWCLGGQTHSRNFDRTSSWTFLHAPTTTLILLRSTYGLYCTLRWTWSTRVSSARMPPSSSMRAFSPTMSTVSSVAGLGNIMPSRIVHKLAIEGHCRANAEGATLRLYMKVGRSNDVFWFPRQEPPFRSFQVWLMFAAPFWSHFKSIYRGKCQNRQLESTPS